MRESVDWKEISKQELMTVLIKMRTQKCPTKRKKIKIVWGI